MRWIDDVRSELQALDVSPRGVRRFAFGVGAVLAVLGAWAGLRNHRPATGAALVGAGALLAAAGAMAPEALRPLHRGWMGLAFALGWVVSRAILVALFALAVTPVALLARLAGKRFLDVRADPERGTYWEARDPRHRSDYEKMY
jgi:hypothetical protein